MKSLGTIRKFDFKRRTYLLVALFAIERIATCSFSIAANAPAVEDDGAIHVPAFNLPDSSYLSEETRSALRRGRAIYRESLAKPKLCPPLQDAQPAQISAIRQCEANTFYKTPLYQSVRQRYAVAINGEEIGGVYTEVFMPASGIAPKNEKRVLINVHGGGFQGGSRSLSHLESIPIAAVGRIKVVSIDYRMAPEHVFPAASEDVASVYRELLKTYKPGSIGLYGCSAGATLVAHSVAWFLKEKLPLPGAIGLFCHGAPGVGKDGKSQWVRSDGAYFSGALTSQNFEQVVEPHPYYKGVDRKTPLASPAGYDDLMGKFPPTLLISGMRDFTLSETLATHAQLVRLGVEADLHVWEGMGHAFHFNPDFQESREAYEVITRFFGRNLGT